MDSREDLRADQPPARRGARLPRPRLRRGDTGQSSPIDPVLKKVRGYNPKADVREIARAYAFAEASHEGQKRKSGEEFITHPLAVTEILADLRLDTTTLEAALLHDTVEDTEVSLADIEQEFGPEVGAHRRRTHEARPPRVPLPRAGAGGERSQDDRRDGR